MKIRVLLLIVEQQVRQLHASCSQRTKPRLPPSGANGYRYVPTMVSISTVFTPPTALAGDDITVANASFPPTSLRLQDYPYIGPSGTIQQGLDQVNNCLTYTQMTLNHLPPALDLDYPRCGNLVNPDQHGIEIISRANFWDDWLLPKLLNPNHDTLLYNAYTHCENNEIDPDFKYKWTFGATTYPESGDPTIEVDGTTTFDPSFFAWTPKISTASSRGPFGQKKTSTMTCEEYLGLR